MQVRTWMAGLVLALAAQAAPAQEIPAQQIKDKGTPEARAPETQIATGRFTTALEVRPILTATIPNWVAIRNYEGQDLLYFTHLLSWRCGLWEIRYGLNGAPPETVVPMEPCHEDTASPNAMVDMDNFSIFITAPGGSIESVDIEIDYDDGTSDAQIFARQSVLMPG